MVTVAMELNGRTVYSQNTKPFCDVSSCLVFENIIVKLESWMLCHIYLFKINRTSHKLHDLKSLITTKDKTFADFGKNTQSI